ncbi:hypothetical protein PsorP6_006645 [Peronosclerospora sorghi]|uniref:Uncharacterized protein n=1 Tax=Peronosclerospora sorghi TaxID=230839 RepID=A0ACC0W8G0_9STRA|nr:hypothetical protein PsorP6_006645 [Peronosclerospora sorghi]
MESQSRWGDPPTHVVENWAPGNVLNDESEKCATRWKRKSGRSQPDAQHNVEQAAREVLPRPKQTEAKRVKQSESQETRCTESERDAEEALLQELCRQAGVTKRFKQQPIADDLKKQTERMVLARTQHPNRVKYFAHPMPTTNLRRQPAQWYCFHAYFT